VIGHNAPLVAGQRVREHPDMSRSRPRTGLRDRVAEVLPGELDQAVKLVTTQVPFFGILQSDEFDQEVAAVAQQNLDLFLRLLQEGRLPAQTEIEFMMRSAARRADEHINLPELLASYYTGFRFCWETMGSVADAGDIEEIVELGSLVLSYLQTVTTAVTEAYVEATTALSGSVRDSRVALLAAVLEARDAEADWRAAGLTPWEGRTVLALRHPPPRHHTDAISTAVSARRRTRDIREALVRLSGADVLDDLTSTGGVVALSGRVDPGGVRTALARVLRSRWHAGIAFAATPGGTPDAASAARDCAEVADRLGYPSGVHQLGELLLEVQVTRPGPARTALRDLLEPLEGSPELLETLSAHVAERGRRTPTARRLHVHPNTLDYRLRRIRELIGVDPNDREGGQLTRAALVVRSYLGGPDARPDAEPPTRTGRR
jgi:hypothetical protein